VIELGCVDAAPDGDDLGGALLGRVLDRRQVRPSAHHLEGVRHGWRLVDVDDALALVDAGRKVPADHALDGGGGERSVRQADAASTAAAVRVDQGTRCHRHHLIHGACAHRGPIAAGSE
jgi:hypothetical protein